MIVDINLLCFGEIMIEYVAGNKTAIILLHEIYGLNRFIMDTALQYHSEGYDVHCPNLLKDDTVFQYEESEAAYRTFIEMAGFEGYKEINKLAFHLKTTYSKLLLVGFSVGATIAWRCSEYTVYDGIMCCYGSRIRDYLMVKPTCPTLVTFAKYDSFDVAGTAMKVQKIKGTSVEILDAGHGFADMYSKGYSYVEKQVLDQNRKRFWDLCIK